MNLDELRSAQAKERRKDSLQHLRDAFYDDVGAYLRDLRDARDRKAETVADPFADDDIRRMSDELETASEVAEALYERRVGKVVKLASFAAAEMSVDTEGMTTEEAALFTDIVSRITSNKSSVLDTLTGETAPAAETTTTPADGDETAPDGPRSVDETQPPDRSGETPASGIAADDVVSAGSSGSASGSVGDPAGSASASLGDPAGSASGSAGDPAASAGDPVASASDPTASADDPAVPASDPDILAGAMGSTSSASGADRGGDSTSDPSSDSDASAGGDATPDDRPATPDPQSRRDATPDGGATAPSAAQSPAVERETVRITRDVGSILGIDEREYDLASEDVVTLPAVNAAPLVDRDAAERIE